MGSKGKWILSVGATPTAHAATQKDKADVDELEGELELYVPAGSRCSAHKLINQDMPGVTVYAIFSNWLQP